jgi:hypothetical protein
MQIMLDDGKHKMDFILNILFIAEKVFFFSSNVLVAWTLPHIRIFQILMSLIYAVKYVLILDCVNWCHGNLKHHEDQRLYWE